MQIDTASKNVSSGFREIGISDVLEKALTAKGITTPTPIQHQAIPLALQGKDLIGVAQTGTGKTFAFGLPMLQRLSEGKKRALIIMPTRELAYQAEEALKPFASKFGIGIAVFVGGAPMGLQKKALRQNPRVLIATPGRLNDHLNQRTVTLNEVEILILDEADRMLDMGFKIQINRILKHVPKERQTLLFSATMPQSIVALATAQMQMPLRIEVAKEGTTADRVEQELMIVRQPDKKTLLKALVGEHEGHILVFSRTKHGAKKITRDLQDAGFKAAEIHSNKTLAQRRAALAGFKSGKYRVLVATDIASRGIDVTNIRLVINYDLPDDPAEYVHRIGRTGRAGNDGKAISLATPTQAKNIRDIERLIRTELPRKGHDIVPDAKLEKGSSGTKSFRSRSNKRSTGRGGKRGGGRSPRRR